MLSEYAHIISRKQMCALLANNGGSKHDYSARLTAHFFGIHLSSTVISACAYILI